MAEPTTAVRIHNTNTRKVFVAEVPVVGGHAAVAGDLRIDGVPGTGAPILLDYAETAGGATGSLLPTGTANDVLDVAGIGPVPATIVDLGNLSVFLPAAALGMTGLEGPAEITAEQLAAVDAAKGAAAQLLGMPTDALVPVPVVVSGPATYPAFGTGELVHATDLDLVARVIGGRPPVLHRAYPGTVAACTAVAAAIPGTTVADLVGRPAEAQLVIGHTSGMMPVRARVRDAGGVWQVEEAAYLRTARRLAEGRAFVRTPTGAV